MARVELKVGEVSFSSEGDEKWVQRQLELMIEHLEKLRGAAQSLGAGTNGIHLGTGAKSSGGAPGALGTYLKNNNVTTNKTKKFLATANWLHLSGKQRLSTGDVAKALSKNSQSPLGNASQCLNDNVKKGHCAKDGQQFFVTDEGRETLK